jgi:hypothetical protein
VQFLKQAAVPGKPTSSNFDRNSSTVIGGFFKASLWNRAAVQNSSTLEQSEILDTQNLLLNLAKHIVRLIAGIADALIPLGAGHANTPDREGFLR